MCANCLSTAEVLLAQAALVGYVVKDPVHRGLAAVGLVDEPDPVAHDVRTVAFLRSLDLDPVEILGADVVASAERWVPQPRREAALLRWFASASPMRSQSLLSVQ